MAQPNTNLLNMGPQELEGFFKSLGHQGFRAKQFMQWVYQRDMTEFSCMHDFPLDLRRQLDELASLPTLTVHTEKTSKDETIKWLLEMDDGNKIETVFIPDTKRGTLCISSQVGCALNCSFCATATQGFNRNLSTSEIVGQIMLAKRRLLELGSSHKITNIVMMGMGEPLLNLDNLIPALQIMRSDYAFGFAKRKVTVSTSGLVPAMDKLNAAVDVALAVSLHAPSDDLRTQLVPLNKKYPIAELLAACKRYCSIKKSNKVTIEYVMLAGVNDSVANARLLAKQLANVPCKVNLIPFNPFPGNNYNCSSSNAIMAFQRCLVERGYLTTVRRTRGPDIDAACGQLRGRLRDKTKRNARFKVTRQVVTVGRNLS